MRRSKTTTTEEWSIGLGHLAVLGAIIYGVAHGAPVASAAATAITVMAWAGAGMLGLSAIGVIGYAALKAWRAPALEEARRVQLEEELVYDEGGRSGYRRRASWPAHIDPGLPPVPYEELGALGRRKRRPVDRPTPQKELPA